MFDTNLVNRTRTNTTVNNTTIFEERFPKGFFDNLDLLDKIALTAPDDKIKEFREWQHGKTYESSDPRQARWQTKNGHFTYTEDEARYRYAASVIAARTKFGGEAA